ncbi:hypothetical protein A3F66_02885 [candidate division TM6 bacterium RIFCSPHIGHO2_12_FULL_32_22]|nr:MAG: hypothetical protein A3F66_02885 [candidate division TM6 bacterium RIFCSPHIGHO2_12_FULL_32_22]
MGKKLGLLLLSSLLCSNVLAIHQINSDEELEILTNKGDVILRCTMDGCHFCTESDQPFKESEKKRPHITHAEAKIKSIPKTAQNNQVTGAPTFLAFKKGQGATKAHAQVAGYNEHVYNDIISKLGNGAQPAAAPAKPAPAKAPAAKPMPMVQDQSKQAPRPMGPIKKLARGEAELLELLADNDVVLAMTMQGCGHCAAAKKELPRIQAEHPEIVIVEADLRDNPDLTNKHNITAAPTFLFYKKGANKPHDKIVGANMPEVEKKVKETAAHKQMHGKKAPAKNAFKKGASKKQEAPAPKKMTKKQMDRMMAKQRMDEKAAAKKNMPNKQMQRAMAKEQAPAPMPAPRKRAMPMKAQKPPRGQKKFVEQQMEGAGCKTSACASCEPCKGGSCNI